MSIISIVKQNTTALQLFTLIEVKMRLSEKANSIAEAKFKDRESFGQLMLNLALL